MVMLDAIDQRGTRLVSGLRDIEAHGNHGFDRKTMKNKYMNMNDKLPMM